MSLLGARTRLGFALQLLAAFLADSGDKRPVHQRQDHRRG
jgi:hypothetical protein